jgi:hypothetical protein
VSGLITSFLLLVYAFIFYATFLNYSDTTSYFPWAWDVIYTDSATVSSMFYGAEAVSVIAIIGCLTLLLAYFPRIRQALK